ncbi:MAG: hypothetical protein FD123_2953 [Bacteroidetes bacterium]|nr:MAG: hypothetical protein FD123_2953 [Bacteroidota bacterium]
MKNLPGIFSFSAFLFISAPALAQEPTGGAQMATAAFTDSLTSRSEKTTDGFYYKAIPVATEKGSRLYVYYSAYGPGYENLQLAFINTAAGKVTKHVCKLTAGSCLGTIEFDTTFTEAGTVNVLYTTTIPGQTLQYTAMAFYASPEALKYNADADLCWKTGYLLKHSDNGFKFIMNDESNGFAAHSTTTPLMKENPASSRIIESIGSIVYTSTLGRGTREQADVYMKQIDESLRQCLGTLFEYKGETDKLTCTASAETYGQVIRNLSYSDKGGKKPKYVITVSVTEKTVQGNKVYDVEMAIKNMFYQF